MKLNRLAALMAAAGSIATLVAGCGGGGGGGGDATPVATTVDVATKVLDGPIANAIVCLDKNDNGVCDADEPSGKTAADGTVTLKVAKDDAGKFPLLALVGTDASDADHGAVASAYVLRAPADSSAAITPLTTLVVAHSAASGQNTADADAALRQQLGLDASLLGDFSTGNDAAAVLRSRDLARVLVLLQQAARTALAPALGGKDGSGATITQDDLDRLAQRVALDDLQDIAALVSADAVRNASGSAELDAALQAAATAFAADHYGDTTIDGVVARLDADKSLASAQPEAEGPIAGGATLRSFTYTDASNWSFRAFQATAEQDTPDADGMAHFTDHRKRAVNSTVQSWGDAADFTLSDVYWTGSEWFACPTTFESSRTLYDANGTSMSLYCRAWTGTSRRSASDIGGAKISDVVAQIRAFPLHDSQVDYPSWGPSPDNAALAGLTFPAGAKLYTYDSTDLTNPDAYGTAPNSIVTPYVADVANGVQAACNQVSPANSASFTFTAATLEALVAAYPGRPCVFTASASTGPRNEWWSNSTISIGTVAAPAPSAGTVYAASRSIRIAFGSGSAVTYYRCSVLASSASSRNCDAIGSGSYSIETLGDARVMRFAGVPADAAPLSYTRLFVERGGVVYYGFHTKPRHDSSLRLNAVATDALFAPLGIVR